MPKNWLKNTNNWSEYTINDIEWAVYRKMIIKEGNIAIHLE